MRFIYLIISIVFFMPLICAAQTADSVSAPAPSDPGDFVDLTGEAVIIKAEPDRPRVNIIADRLKPTFDSINLEKSFYDELVGKSERIIVLEDRSEKELQPIDVEKILNKMR
jgi:hypothetical protein